MTRATPDDDSRELILTIADDAVITPSLRKVYEGVPARVVREIEARRFSVMYASVTHLAMVRDLLEGYPGKFKDWCDACGFRYDGVKGAIRRYEARLVERGKHTTPNGHQIAPFRLRARDSQWASWALRRILTADAAEFERMFLGYGPEWLARAVRDRQPEDIRERCARLAALLMGAYARRTVEGMVAHGPTDE